MSQRSLSQQIRIWLPHFRIQMLRLLEHNCRAIAREVGIQNTGATKGLANDLADIFGGRLPKLPPESPSPLVYI